MLGTLDYYLNILLQMAEIFGRAKFYSSDDVDELEFDYYKF
jgi:hypothetical protein